MTPLKPKCIYRVNLCDLPWKQAEKSKDEYECLFERKMQGPKLKKSLEFSILLSFYNTNPTEKKPIQRSVINTSIPNENTFRSCANCVRNQYLTFKGVPFDVIGEP